MHNSLNRYETALASEATPAGASIAEAIQKHMNIIAWFRRKGNIKKWKINVEYHKNNKCYKLPADHDSAMQFSRISDDYLVEIKENMDTLIESLQKKE